MVQLTNGFRQPTGRLKTDKECNIR